VKQLGICLRFKVVKNIIDILVQVLSTYNLVSLVYLVSEFENQATTNGRLFTVINDINIDDMNWSITL
jgi:hypothetical protein